MSTGPDTDPERETEPLLFRSLNVTRVPGIDPPGFSLDEFSSGVNVIHGPNAAGKTMLARSMNTLLWPDVLDTAGVLVRGEWSANDSVWFVKVEGQKRTIQQNGSSEAGPALPPFEQRDRYNLALHELLQDRTTDRSFAELIVQELFGGYNVTAAAGVLGFDEDHSYPGKTNQRAKDALENLREAQDEMNELEREEQELSRLRNQKEKADQARERLELMQRVLDVFEAREEYRNVQRKIDEFPEVMEDVTGRERERLDQLTQNITDLQDQKEEAKTEIKRANDTIEELEYPYDRAITNKIRTWENEYENLKDLDDAIDELSDQKAAAEAKRNEEQREFAEQSDPDRLAQLGHPDYNEVEEFARNAEDVRLRKEALEQLRSVLDLDDAPGEQPTLDQLKRGCDVLENWLSHPPEERSPEPGRDWTFHVSQGIILLAGLAGGFVHPVFFLLLPLPVILYVLHGLRDGKTGESMRPTARQEFQQLDLPGEPEDWNPDSVRSHLQELYKQRAQQLVRETKRDCWKRQEDEYNQLLERVEELEERRAEIEDEFGFAPDADDRTLHFLLNRLSRWKDAHAEVQKFEEKRSQKQDRYDQVLSALNEEFQTWDLPEVDDPSEVRSHLDDIKQRTEQFREAKRTLEQARKRKREAESELPDLNERRAQLYNNLDLEPGDEAALEQLVDQRETYQELQSELHQKKGAYESKVQEVKEHSLFDPDLLDRDPSAIRRDMESLEEQASELEELTTKIGRIEEKLDQARRGYEVEPALAEKERAFDELHDQLESDYEKMVGHTLARYVQTVNNAQTMPAVFERARELLATISTGRYELNVEQSDPPSFRVVDTLHGEGKSLDELSAGTRIQVLLAVRLAFCQQGEEHVRVPLFMDETLANADDRRARTIINSVLNLSKDGRQVFYFTAQGDEVAKWQSVAEERDESIKTFDLREHTDRDLDGSVRIPEMSEVQSEDEHIPEPSGHDHESYGQALDIPPLDPRDGVGSAHLWYLVEDVDTLAHLLEGGIRRWGPLETLMDHGVEVVDSDSGRPAIRRARQRARAVEAFVEQWQIGRNKRVHRPELRASGAVSEHFIDEVTDLAESCGGDPEELVKRLRDGEVSGFRTNKMDELEEFLVREGYIDTEEPLDPELIRAAMRSAVDEEVLENPGEEITRLWNRIRRHVGESTE